jgi:hypothetical protein
MIELFYWTVWVFELWVFTGSVVFGLGPLWYFYHNDFEGELNFWESFEVTMQYTTLFDFGMMASRGPFQAKNLYGIIKIRKGLRDGTIQPIRFSEVRSEEGRREMGEEYEEETRDS